MTDDTIPKDVLRDMGVECRDTLDEGYLRELAGRSVLRKIDEEAGVTDTADIPGDVLEQIHIEFGDAAAYETQLAQVIAIHPDDLTAIPGVLNKPLNSVDLHRLGEPTGIDHVNGSIKSLVDRFEQGQNSLIVAGGVEVLTHVEQDPLHCADDAFDAELRTDHGAPRLAAV